MVVVRRSADKQAVRAKSYSIHKKSSNHYLKEVNQYGHCISVYTMMVWGNFHLHYKLHRIPVELILILNVHPGGFEKIGSAETRDKSPRFAKAPRNMPHGI